MKIITPSYKIEYYDVASLLRIEKIARTCYKSEDRIGPGTAEPLIERLIRNGHEAMIEHSSVTVRFIHNRGFSHEIVRHRLASFAQESTRYVKYDNDMEFIEPYWMNENTIDAGIGWLHLMGTIEKAYREMLDDGLQPQAARGILPNDLKTEIVVTANFREWRTIFKLRCDKAAHPDMRRVMIPLLEDLKKIFPVIFSDLTNN